MKEGLPRFTNERTNGGFGPSYWIRPKDKERVYPNRRGLRERLPKAGFAARLWQPDHSRWVKCSISGLLTSQKGRRKFPKVIYGPNRFVASDSPKNRSHKVS